MEPSDTTGRSGTGPDEPSGQDSAPREGAGQAGDAGHERGAPVSDGQRRRFLEALARKQGKGPAASPGHGEATGGRMGSESSARTQRMFRRKSG
jgi:Family of unknown function (DUF5302)